MLPDAAHPERGTLRPRPGRRAARARRASRSSSTSSRRGRARSPPRRSTCVGATAHERGRRGRGAPPRFDVVHAHFGLTAWPALAVPARVRALTVHGTDMRHPRTRLITARRAAADRPARGRVERRWPPNCRLDARGARAQVLPCGVDLERFRPLAARAGARRAGPRLRAAVPAVRRRPRPSGQALRPRARARAARSASSCSRSAGSIPRACRCGSTPPTPC